MAAAIRPLWLRILLIAVQVVLAITAGFFLMWPLAVASDFLHLSYFNTWSLVHGGAGVTWPALAIFSFALLGYVKWFYRLRDAPLLAVGILFGLVLKGQMRMPEPPDYSMVPPYAVAGACIGAALLCYFAKRRWPLALVIAFPSFDVSWLFMASPFDPEAWHYYRMVLADSVPLTVAPFVGAGLAEIARRIALRARA